MEGKGQRWAASLKIEAERTRAEQGHERKVVRAGFETVPGRGSGVVAARRVKAVDEMERRASNAAAVGHNDKELPQLPSSFSWSSARQKSPLPFRQRMSVMMQVLTPPKSRFSGSTGGQASAASIRYIGPPRMAIVHEEGGELWKVAAPRSSLVMGNKDLRRTLQVVTSRT